MPSGDTALSIMLLLPQHGYAVEIRQQLPFAMPQPVLIVDRFPDMVIDGSGVNTTERSLNGRDFFVAQIAPITAGGDFNVRLANLPHASTVARDVAVGIAALLALWGLALALKSRPAETPPADLERRREALLAELVALDEKSAPGDKSSSSSGGREGKRARRREELTEQLERLYRDAGG